jgi:hypothetical protein
MLGQLVRQEVERLESQGLIGNTICECAFCDGQCIDEGIIHVGPHRGKQLLRCLKCGSYQRKGQSIEPMG